MRTRSFVVAALVLTPVMAWVVHVPLPVVATPVPKPVHRDPVGCVIEGDATCELGQVPEIRVALINQTDHNIYLAGSLDASDYQWRYPFCYFEVIGPNGEPAAFEIPRCGCITPLQSEDFVEVPPGKSFNPFHSSKEGHWFFPASQMEPSTFKVPGEYRIRFFYSTKCDDIAQWMSLRHLFDDGGAAIDKLFQLVPKVEVRSNDLFVTVNTPNK